ncbi:interleukin-15 receptor subunit alpha-like isoform X1 [Polyodon spathula]|uniref:interleukin-15 receptor subunit alpha-like isoform X1 n=1 Tax=Polyodon spathula TaxID=7913 RepID=UPI001B7DB9BF|nr:interleukin-15 receptor subunit alpha-like isoform X1 [Polyodon spathula]
MNHRTVLFLLLLSFSNYTDRDTVWAADKYSTDRCEHPAPLQFTDEFEEYSFLVGKSYRYNCTRGYKRKAGTSSLIHCMNESGIAQWSVPNLMCIRDPKLKGATDPPQMNKGSTADITEQSAAISVGVKAGGSVAAVLLLIIITAIGICIYKIKWGRNIILTPATELQTMTNPEQPSPLMSG